VSPSLSNPNEIGSEKGVKGRWELTLLFPSKGMRDATSALLRQLQKEEGLEQRGESLAFFLLGEWRKLREHRELKRVKTKLRHLLSTIKRGKKVGRREIKWLEESLEESLDETASHAGTAERESLNQCVEGPGGEEMVPEFLSRSRDEGRSEVARL